jgi:NADPH-dependent glutamate synthase beta subunit-like oxidoreductase/NAD-dependent dihydropyrimidine dehydrogenase PreA subunit
MKLATKISLECGTYTGITVNDPEYKILDPVLTDEMAEVAMGLRVRKPRTAEDVAKKVKKPLDRVEEILYHLGDLGVTRYHYDKERGCDVFVMPIWVPGIMEMMVGNAEMVEKYPVIAECFEEYTRKRIRPITPYIPVGQGMMRVIPVESALENEKHVGTNEEISEIVENATRIAVTDCSCRRTRRLMGEGCGHLEKDVCIFFNEAAEYHIRTGHGREIDKEECYDILRRCEENGLIHEVSNLDPETGRFAAICNCCGCSCFSLRIAEYFQTPDTIRSNYKANVDKDKCVACGQCVENCQVNALKLGQKLCEIPSFTVAEKTPDDTLWWSSRNFRPNYREERAIVAEDGTAPCKTHCPAHIPVQGYLKLAAQGRYDEALQLIREENPFPAVCGRICPRFCEEECTRGNIDAPVAIDEVKKFLAERELDPKTRTIPKMKNMTGKPFEEKVAVIGAGPAGLSCAYYLALWGYPVTVFEKENKLGGMLTLGIPSYRLAKDVIEAEIDIIREMGVEFRTGVEIGKDKTLDELRAEGFKAFFAGIGAWKSSPIGVPGEELEGVYHGIEFLKELNLGRKPKLGRRVAVIGGGNVAIDVARSAVRLGADEVSIIYRRGREEMPAAEEEIQEALDEGVKIRFLESPLEILGKWGKVRALKVQKMQLSEQKDETGRFKVKALEGKTEELRLDSVIAAIGQSVDWGKILEGSSVKTDKRGFAEADEFTLQTGESDVFVGGDAYTGPSFVIDAIAAGKEAAISINRFVHEGQSLTIGRHRKNYFEFNKSEAKLSGFDRAPRQAPPIVDGAKRKRTFEDLRSVLTEEQVRKETERCLGCGAVVVDRQACLGCGICTTKCKFDAISLIKVDHKPGENYEKLILRTGENVLKRAGKLLVNIGKK